VKQRKNIVAGSMGAMTLRARGHDYELPTVKFEFNKRNFIVRSLFQYVYTDL